MRLVHGLGLLADCVVTLKQRLAQFGLGVVGFHRLELGVKLLVLFLDFRDQFINRLAGVGIVGRLWLALLLGLRHFAFASFFQTGSDAGALFLVAFALGCKFGLELGFWHCGQLLGAAGEVVANAYIGQLRRGFAVLVRNEGGALLQFALVQSAISFLCRKHFAKAALSTNADFGRIDL